MKTFGILLLALGIGIALYVFYNNSRYSTTTRPFSNYTIVNSSWEKYKQKFINQDGRVTDYSQGDITTSEGQSYALLRAVWIDDKPTFDLVWKWTQENLQKRPNDRLFGWKWGKRDDGNYGFLANGGDNTASDSDEDIALALIFAANRWQQQSYKDEAIKILHDLWEIDTTSINKARYMTAGNWAATKDQAVINPSYFAPYAWRIFATVDTEHDWNSLVNPAYDLLTQATQSPLDKTQSANLPPDWITINTKGEISKASVDQLTTDYGFDAIRIPWRIAVDYQWNGNQQAKDYLSLMCSKLDQDYSQNGIIYIGYSHDGQPLQPIENPATYATSLGCFTVLDPTKAQSIYQDKILRLYSNDNSTFNDDIPYYEQNWLWLGSALYNQQIIKL